MYGLRCWLLKDTYHPVTKILQTIEPFGRKAVDSVCKKKTFEVFVGGFDLFCRAPCTIQRQPLGSCGGRRKSSNPWHGGCPTRKVRGDSNKPFLHECLGFRREGGRVSFILALDCCMSRMVAGPREIWSMAIWARTGLETQGGDLTRELLYHWYQIFRCMRRGKSAVSIY